MRHGLLSVFLLALFITVNAAATKMCPNCGRMYPDDCNFCEDCLPPTELVVSEKQPTDEGVVMETIFFELGSAELTESQYLQLDNAGWILTENPAIVIELSGHSAQTGSGSSKERELSLERANAVKEYLVDRWDIDPYRIKSRGYGSLMPIASNKTEAGRKKNARVEFHILRK
jgi:outer membrane protein OmpA-like peptidoglycan-associated protein